MSYSYKDEDRPPKRYRLSWRTWSDSSEWDCVRDMIHEHPRRLMPNLLAILTGPPMACGPVRGISVK